MKEKFVFEILLTTNHVTEENWLLFLNTIAKLNGYFHRFELYATTHLNEVRFFLVTDHLIPPILNSLGDFLIKKLENCEEIHFKSFLAPIPFYLITNKERNLLNISDKTESRKNEKLCAVKMSLVSFRKDHFFTKTNLYFQ